VFLQRILAHPAFASAELDTGFIERHQAVLLPESTTLPAEFWNLAAEAMRQSEVQRQRADDPNSSWAINSGWRAGGPTEINLHLQCNGEQQQVRLRHGTAIQLRLQGEYLQVEQDGQRRQHLAIRRGSHLYLQWQDELLCVTVYDPIAAAEASHHAHGGMTAPMNGSIVRVLVEVGQTVEAGTALVVLEAMKMEHSIRAAEAGVVKALYCAEGDMVTEGSTLVELEPA